MRSYFPGFLIFCPGYIKILHTSITSAWDALAKNKIKNGGPLMEHEIFGKIIIVFLNFHGGGWCFLGFLHFLSNPQEVDWYFIWWPGMCPFEIRNNMERPSSSLRDILENIGNFVSNWTIFSYFCSPRPYILEKKFFFSKKTIVRSR